METSNFLIELLGKSVDTQLVVVALDGDLGESLVGERVGHDEAGVTSGASQVHQATLGEQNDGAAVREGVLVNLRLDLLVLDSREGLETNNINLVIKVTNVADDGLVPHLLHVLGHYNVLVTGGGDVDLSTVQDILNSVDLISGHGSLESADGIDLTDDHTSSLSTERVSATLSDITETGDEGNLTTDHDISGTEDTINEGVAATVDVVELALGDRVVDVDGGEQKFTTAHHLVQTVNTGGGLLRDSLDLRDDLVPVSRLLGKDTLENLVANLDLLVSVVDIEDGGIVLRLVSTVDHESGVTTIIDDESGALVVRPHEALESALPVLLKGLSLPGKDSGGTGRGNGGSSVILSGIDVATAPPHISTESSDSLNQDSSLHSHVEGSRDASSLEGLLGPVLGTGSHETGHLMLCEVNFAPAELGEADILDLILVGGHCN